TFVTSDSDGIAAVLVRMRLRPDWQHGVDPSQGRFSLSDVAVRAGSPRRVELHARKRDAHAIDGRYRLGCRHVIDVAVRAAPDFRSRDPPCPRGVSNVVLMAERAVGR